MASGLNTTNAATTAMASALNTTNAATTIMQYTQWVSAKGVVGLFAFAAVHAAAVVVCFPATILFELAAGFAFGVLIGTPLVWSAKMCAATFTYMVSNGIARAVLSRAGVEHIVTHAFASQPRLARLAGNVEANGARYTLLARLSPIPSWLNNYGLAFAGVRFADYFPATALATLPMVLVNVYTGSLLSSLLSLSDGAPPTLAAELFGGLSIIVSVLLLRQCLMVATAEDDDSMGGPQSQVGGVRPGGEKANHRSVPHTAKLLQ